VIANERQYRIAKAELCRFEEAIDAQQESTAGRGIHPRVHKAISASLESEADELRAQVKRYEDLRDGHIDHREPESLGDLPSVLIEARIAAGLNQRALAERLGLHQQQIQRWEASLYSGVGVERLQEVADALGTGIRMSVSYAAPDRIQGKRASAGSARSAALR
jgi:ribosome-binding protein aMBF1 (putative translation factor)